MSKNNVILTIPEPGKFELVEKPFPKIKPGYAVIKTEIAPVYEEQGEQRLYVSTDDMRAALAAWLQQIENSAR